MLFGCQFFHIHPLVFVVSAIFIVIYKFKINIIELFQFHSFISSFVSNLCAVTSIHHLFFVFFRCSFFHIHSLVFISIMQLLDPLYTNVRFSWTSCPGFMLSLFSKVVHHDRLVDLTSSYKSFYPGETSHTFCQNLTLISCQSHSVRLITSGRF